MSACEGYSAAAVAGGRGVTDGAYVKAFLLFSSSTSVPFTAPEYQNAKPDLLKN